jgi:hypothetical protein
MLAMPKLLNLKLQTVEFTFGGLFTFDVFKTERELSPVPMMANFYVTPGGAVSIASLWVKRWIGELTQWQPVHLPRFQVVLIEAQIEDGLRKERDEDARNVREVARGFA